MNTQPHTRRATLDDAPWIVALSARVQAALTASGSLQHIGPLSLDEVEHSIRVGFPCVLEIAGRPVGSVLIDPIERDSPLLVQVGLHHLPGPLWFLHALMLEPAEQGKRLGLSFLEGIKHLVVPTAGSIILDCWAGNTKLRDFYHRTGFTFHGILGVKDYEVAVFYFTAPASSSS